MVTLPEAPSKESAPPYLPAGSQVAPAPDSVPSLPLPDESPTVVPVPSLKPHAPTSPGGTGVESKVAV